MQSKDHQSNEEQRARNASRAIRDFILDASEDELRDAFVGSDETLEQAAERARKVASRALQHVLGEGLPPVAEPREIEDLHRGLGTLLQLLRRKARLSEEDLAARARVLPEEIRRIEFDPTFAPSPRTIYQLEDYFELPHRALVLLSGAVRSRGGELRQTAVRFAAHSKAIGRLTHEELELLNEFVAFLKDRAKDV